MTAQFIKNRALMEKLKEGDIPKIDFDLAGSAQDYSLESLEEEILLPQPKPQEELDRIKEENFETAKPFLMDESIDFIERESFADGPKRQITDQEFRRLYKNFSGTDVEFAEFLNNQNIRPGRPGIETGVKGGGFTDKTVFGRRNRLGIKANIEAGTSPKFEKQYNQRNKVLTKLVAEANAGDKYVSTQQLVFKAEDELGMKPRYDTELTLEGKKKRKPNLRSFDKGSTRGFPILNELDTPVEKVDKVIKDLLNSNSPQTEGLTKTIIRRTGISQPLFIQIRDKVPSYKTIKPEAERLPLFLNKANNAYLLELPLAEQLKEVNTLIKGNPAYTYGTGKTVLKTVATAKNDAMQYALRSWNLNKGQGDIKFFNAKGKLIPWQKGTRLKYGKVSFEYNGKKYNTSNLTPDILKKDFKELYETRDALNKFRGQKVPNPFKKGQTIPVEKLIRKIQVDGYGWSPSFSTLEILHGTEGVKNKPFTDLRFNTKDINMVESSLSKNLASNKITETEFKKAMANVNKPFAKGGEKFIIDRITKQAEQIKKGKFYGFEELKKKSVADTLSNRLSNRLGMNVDPEMLIKAVDRNYLKPSPLSTSRKVANLARGVAKFTGAEAALAPIFGVIDTKRGLTPKEIALNIATLGTGVPIKDALEKSKFIKDLGLKKEYASAVEKRDRADRALEAEVEQVGVDTPATEFAKPEYTTDEEAALLAENYFNFLKEGTRLEQKKAYEKDFERSLKAGEFEIGGEETVPERFGVKAEFLPEDDDEETEIESPFGLKAADQFPRDFMAEGGIMRILKK